MSGSTHVAFLGLGIMGTGMALRLAKAGFPVTAYNRDRAKTAPLAAAGAKIAASPREAAAGADVILSMVADDPVSRAVWLGESGALAGAKRGALCIESSTLTVAWVRELAAAVQAKGCELLDAPVTGSKVAAANGELNFIVGGTAAALERARPVLSPMSKTIKHLGPIGSGALIKLINNFVCGVQVASVAEAIAMMERGGLDRAQALTVLLDGAPGSPLVKTVAARMLAGDYTPNFKLKLMAKDLGYAQQEGAALGLDLKTASAGLAEFQKAIAAGIGEQDMAAIVEALRKK
jgi:3-hydroxyisobutyrate dehydrogenase